MPNDVEFVLGSSRIIKRYPTEEELDELERSGPQDTRKFNYQRREICLWMFDFDKVRPMSWDEEGVKLAVNSVVKNDPYYPKPPKAGEDKNGLKQSLWTFFKSSYLDASDRLGETHNASEMTIIKSLSRRFIQEWEDDGAGIAAA